MISTIVALLQPPGLCRAFTRSASSFPPLGLAQLSAVINDKNRCQVIDADGFAWNDEETISYLKSYSSPPKVIGMTVTTGTTHVIEKWSKNIKNKVDSNIKIIVGGPHASLDPYDTIQKCPSIDYLVKGEGELIFKNITNIFENDSSDKIIQNMNKLPGIIDIKNRKWTKNELRKAQILRVDDFSDLPFPSLDDLPIKNYQCPDAQKRPMIGFMTQRGCPMKCGFCSTPTLHGKKVRGWSVEQILNELEYQYYEYGIREITFFDDIFSIKPSRTKKICQGMIDRKMNDLSWFCNGRVDLVNEEVCTIMKKAGCHLMYLGFESGSDLMLKRIDKGVNSTRLEHGASIVKKSGIDVSVGFVIGLPGENDDSVNDSIQLAKRIKPDRLQFTRWTPLAGSPLVENDVHQQDDYINVKSFHNRENNDKISEWIDKCYKECDYSQNGWAKASW